MTDEYELLLVDPAGDSHLPWPIVAAAADRVIVVRVPSVELDRAAEAARYAIARAPSGEVTTRGDAGVTSELDAGARLFVDAFRQPRPEKSDRPGEGASWAAPGFVPPDLPSR